MSFLKAFQVSVCKKDSKLFSSLCRCFNRFCIFSSSFFKDPKLFAAHFLQESQEIFFYSKKISRFSKCFFRCFKIFYALFFTETRLFQLAFSMLFRSRLFQSHLCFSSCVSSIYNKFKHTKKLFWFLLQVPWHFWAKRPACYSTAKKNVSRCCFFVFSPWYRYSQATTMLRGWPHFLRLPNF